MKKTVLLTAILSALGTASVAQAEDASPHSISYNVGLFSQYVFRGISQTDKDMALQGGVDYAHDNGFYVGAWGSNISWLTDSNTYTSSSMELDIYAGFAGEFANGIGYDIGVLQYIYPGNKPSGVTDADTTEVYGGLSYGYFSGSVAIAVSDDLFGIKGAGGGYYVDLGADFPLPHDFTASVHIGYQDFDDKAEEYTDWKLGLAKAFSNDVEVGAYYTDTNEEDTLGDIGGELFTVYVTKSF